jgi:ketosteroid isomerase-like protein
VFALATFCSAYAKIAYDARAMDLSPRTLLSRSQAMDFAQSWVDAWNARDLEKILGLFATDAVFTSPKAAAVTGRGTQEGLAAMRRYWESALQRINSLRFELLEAHWDPDASTLWVVYLSELNGTRHRSCEVFKFGPGDKVREGEAFYGAPA